MSSTEEMQSERTEPPTSQVQERSARTRRVRTLLVVVGVGIVLLTGYLLLGTDQVPDEPAAPPARTEERAAEEDDAEQASAPQVPYEVQYTESDEPDEREFRTLDGATLDGPLNLYVDVPEDEAEDIEKIVLREGDRVLWEQVAWPYGDAQPVSLRTGEHTVYGLLTYVDGSTARTPESTFTVGESSVAEETRVPVDEDSTPEPLGRAIGFGRNVTGGEGGDVYWVTTTADSGPGSLREAASSGRPAWIRFAVAGTIELETDLLVGSDITIDGRDAAVTISGRGLELNDVENVIIVNLTFRNGEGSGTDAVRVINGTTGVWIQHCTFADYPDGLVDITRESTDVTVSYNEFSDHTKVMLINDQNPQDDPARVTVHHNLFDGTYVRHPKARWAYVHLFNNYVRNWGSDGRGSAVDADTDAEIYSENNIFEAGELDRAMTSAEDAEPRGRILSTGDLLMDGAEIREYRSSEVFDPYDYYDANPEEASSELRQRIEAEAGVQQP